MIPIANRSSLLNDIGAQSTATADSRLSSATAGLSTAAKARLAAAGQAALAKAGNAPKASASGHALDRQQAALATDLRSAMGKAGVKLTGSVDFSVSSDGKVEIRGNDADKAATRALLKADTRQPSLATRIATQAKDALRLSAGLQQSAAASQAARYGGGRGGVLSLYTSLMQTSSPSTAVFSVSAASSSLTYPGSLAAKA